MKQSVTRESIIIKAIRKPSSSIQKQLNGLSRVSFPWTFEEVEKDKFCSQNDIVCQVVAFENDTVVGKVGVLKRNIIYQGKSIVLGGLGGMSVVKEMQQMGIGKRLLETGVQKLHEKKCGIAYLCTNFDKPWLIQFYSRVGFVPLDRPYTYVGKSGKRYTEDDGMIAALGSKELFTYVLGQKTPFDIGRGNW